ncbi:MAG TPA: GNAT family N-acetyltransferase [Opitutaceae bacterium]|nr:GNAT family N-acetyltransferase [Opitutaceae bacterium]
MSDSVRIFHVESDPDFERAFPVMVQLRPHLTPETFRVRVRQQAMQGYRLAALESGGAIRSLAGYRLLDYLWVGRAMYVDDLVTDAAARSRGHGERLFAWLKETAAADGCLELHLDSAVHRKDAHRFYFRERMHVLGFHFVLPLRPSSVNS